MKKLHLQRREVDLDFYRHNRPIENHFSTLIDEPTAIYENGQLMIVYDTPDNLKAPLEPLRWAVQSIKYSKSHRSNGLVSTMRTFGYAPRHTARNDFCRSTLLAREFPEQHKVLCDFAENLTDVYADWNPDFYNKHKAITQEHVLPDYQLLGGVFTSGIINKTTALGYHFDSGNFSQVWSNMVVLRDGTTGGALSVPEYDLGFALRDGSVLLFDGQGLLHGVTPIKKTHANGYRYSVVYYSLRQMWSCLAISDEIIRIRQKSTERARKRLLTDRPDLTNG